jgi:hypothetical protein
MKKRDNLQKDLMNATTTTALQVAAANLALVIERERMIATAEVYARAANHFDNGATTKDLRFMSKTIFQTLGVTDRNKEPCYEDALVQVLVAARKWCETDAGSEAESEAGMNLEGKVIRAEKAYYGETHNAEVTGA